MPLSVRPFELTLPTYQAELASRLAPLFEKGKVPLYPYTNFVRTLEQAQPRTYRLWALENDLLRVLIAPELGGRVYSLRDKRLPAPPGDPGPGAELLFANPVVKPGRIEPRNAWLSAGIEFNFPVAHSHTTLEAVASRAWQEDGRAYVEVGETERRLGLQWLVRLSLGEGEDTLTQETFVGNPTPEPASWQLWTNAGVLAFGETEFVYPPAKVYIHGSKDQYGRWPQGWSRQKECEQMLGLFWLDQTSIYFGVYHHNLGFGLLHLADPEVLPGMKMWTFGRVQTPGYMKMLSDGSRDYVEIQSGAFKTQDDFRPLDPGQSRRFVEFWRPVRDRAAFESARLPAPRLSLRPPQWFGMEHIPEAARWLKVIAAARGNDPQALPPYDPAGTDWPPTGLPLERPLYWASRFDPAYVTALGTWLAAKERYGEAAKVLEGTADDCGRRVRGLLAWQVEGDLGKARGFYEQTRIGETGHLLDLDALLAQLGDHSARLKVLDRLDPSEGRVVERLADQAVGAGNPQRALDLLLARPWTKQHERYLRTDIWRRARAALGLPQDPVPVELGEDPVPPIDEAPTPHGPLDGALRRVPLCFR